MEDDKKYPKESILVHEFAHHIMNLGVSTAQRRRIQQAYEAARAKGLYKPDIYMMANADEYWAEGTQAFFDASVRTDVNDGINSREGLTAHDPRLAALVEEVYGRNQWRYSQDM